MVRITMAGLPAAIQLEGIMPETADAAAIIELSPIIVTPFL